MAVSHKQIHAASPDLATRRSTCRVPLASTRLRATTEQPEGHSVSEGKEADADVNSNGQDSLSNTATMEKPAAAAAESAVGTSSPGGGEGGLGSSQTVAAVAQEADAAAGVGQSKEEKEVMEELLAHQPGGEEGAGEVEGPPKPTVRNMFCLSVPLRAVLSHSCNSLRGHLRVDEGGCYSLLGMLGVASSSGRANGPWKALCPWRSFPVDLAAA